MSNDDKQQTTSTPPIFVDSGDAPPMINLEQTDVINSSPVATSSVAPADDIILPVMPATVTSGSPKKKFAGGKIIATILGLFLLVGGVGAGVYLVGQNQDVREKAYTNVTTPSTDTCGFVQVSASENANCPRLNNNTGTNNISSHSVTYTIKNITNKIHKVDISRKSNFCTEPYGQVDPKLPDWPVCYSSTITNSSSADFITLNPGESKTVIIERGSDRNMACGSYQTDLYIKSIDGDTKCRGRDKNGLIAASLCQTGIACSSGGGGSSYCQQIKAYSSNWTLLTTAQLSALKAGDSVNFCATGVAGSGAFNKARFKINGTQRPETTTIRPNSQDFCDTYTVGEEKAFNITAELYHTTLGWK